MLFWRDRAKLYLRNKHMCPGNAMSDKKDGKAPTKAEAVEQAERAAQAAKRWRQKVADMEASVAASDSRLLHVGVDLAMEVVTIGTGMTAGYLRGRYRESYTVLGMDAAMVAGVPLLAAGFVASLMGYPTIGRGIGAAGRGFVVESLAYRAYGYGMKKGDEKREDKAPAAPRKEVIDAEPEAPKGLPDYQLDHNGVRRTSGVTVHRTTNRYPNVG